MKRILLTGAGPSGFIGRNLAQSLRGQYDLFTPPSSELDLCNYGAVERYITDHRIAAVIHSAVHNPISRGEENMLRNDMAMFLNLHRISQSLDQLIYFGSGAEFDKREAIIMAKEEDFGNRVPLDNYGVAKYNMNLLCQKSENIKNLRLFGIFGRYEYWPLKFISNLCCKAVFGLPLTVRQNCKFDFLYINDLAAIVRYFLDHNTTYCEYNVCSGQPVELVAIAEMVREVSGKDLEVSIAQEGYNLEYTASNERLITEIPGLEFTSIRESIADLYKYYSDNRDLIDFTILKQSR